MALVLKDRVKETTTSTGTGTITLAGAVAGFQSFSVVGNANTCYYCIAGGAEWEVGVGTYSTTGPTLARTTVLESSNAGNLVSFSAGTKDVFLTYPAELAVTTDAAQTLTNKTLTDPAIAGAIKDSVFAITDGASVDINPSNGAIQTWTLGTSVTRTPTASSFLDGEAVTLMVDDGTTSTISWTTIAPTWKTDAGSAPTLNLTGYTVIVLWKVGGVMYGARVGNN